MTDEVKPEQRHRDAASRLLGGAAPYGLLDGKRDSLSLVQAFARFERDHLTPPPPQPDADRAAMAREVLATVTESMAVKGSYVAADIRADNLSPENKRALAAMLAFADQRVAALEVERDALREQVQKLQGAISWIDKPFTDGIGEPELRQRIQYVLDDAARCVAATNVEAKP